VLVVGMGTAIMLVSYHWMVRSTFIGALLNGRRYPRNKAKPAAAA
jgi:glucans biosynthesis protein C